MDSRNIKALQLQQGLALCRESEILMLFQTVMLGKFALLHYAKC